MNRPIRKVALALAVLFLALFVNLNFVQVVKGSSYRDDPGNRRVLLNEYSSPRGQLVVQGNAVAQSKATQDELKYLRVYPHGMIYAPATGYYSFTYGASGIEYAENDILSGDSAELFTTKLTNILTGRNPRGGSVDLSLNKAAQTAAYNAMRGANGKLRRGAVVALDPTTGAILALVSTPSFDPNELSSHNGRANEHASSCYVELNFPTKSQTESEADYTRRASESIRIQLLLRRSGSDGLRAANQRNPKRYPLTGMVYIQDSSGVGHPQAVSYLSQFPNFGKSGCGDVTGDPTALYAANHHAISPLHDRAIDQVYPAGSIFKIIDSASALKKGIKPTDRIPAPNSYWPLDPKRTDRCPANLSGACVQNFGGETCDNGKTATLDFAFAKSCNTAFASLAVTNIGGSDLAAQAKAFGFDEPFAGSSPPSFCEPPAFSMPLPVCRSSPGSVSDMSDNAALAQTAFGQRDVRITPMQAAMLASAVANNGLLMKPYLVSKELRPNFSVLNTTPATELGQVIDPGLDQDLIKMMEDVVYRPEGTGGLARIPELEPRVKIGGKTGTADVGATSASNVQPDAWFTGFALANGEPKIAVAVLIENGGVAGDESAGGKAAAPVAQAVMKAYLNSPGVS